MPNLMNADLVALQLSGSALNTALVTGTDYDVRCEAERVLDVLARVLKDNDMSLLNRREADARLANFRRLLAVKEG